MNEPKICCNCLHCARWQTSKGIECHCDLTDKRLGYLDVMDEDNDCKHWEKETKWDLQRKHDSELLDKVLQKFIELDSRVKEIREDRVCFFTIENVLKVIEEMKAEVSNGRNDYK